MERRWCAQAARSVFRRLGPGRRSHGRGPQAAFLDLVRVASDRSRFREAKRWRWRVECDMPINAIYKAPSDLPEIIPVFPLPGALLLPRGQMPLNIFEPRYLALIDDALRSGHRLIGMIQPDPAHPGADETKPHLFQIGCVGRMTQFAESGDGRYLIQLTGVAPFRVEQELAVATLYRQCQVTYQPFIDDFTARKGEDEVDRKALLRALSSFLKANNLKADWEG